MKKISRIMEWVPFIGAIWMLCYGIHKTHVFKDEHKLDVVTINAIVHGVGLGVPLGLILATI